MKNKYLVCTRNLQWIEPADNTTAIGAKIRKLKNRGYKRSFIEVYKLIPYPYYSNKLGEIKQ